jgi:hypothetical protein
MILDKNTLLSDDQAVTATAISENVIDLAVLGTTYDGVALSRKEGTLQKVPFLVQVTADFATLTSLTISIESSAAAGLTSPTVHFSQVIAVADLVAGKKISYDFLPNGITGRYLGLRYTVTGSNATAGNITAGVVAAVDHAYQG